jgi:phosphoribosylanthranilate isomerase
MTLIKICGITTLTDARAASAAGADLLGFNFYRPSPRYVEPLAAREIADVLRAENLDRAINFIGVFVNAASPADIASVVRTSALDGVQLHGDESVEFCRELRALLPDFCLIKVFRVKSGFDSGELRGYDVDAIMLDTFHEHIRGGTGKIFDWTIARSTRALVPRLFLAGGLSPENVAEAIAQVDPYAVDACSSLEWSPGHKDTRRMEEFVQAARKR